LGENYLSKGIIEIFESLTTALMRVYYSGYFARSKGYKYYNKRKKKIEDCIDVIVDEISSQLESSKKKHKLRW